jgi:hypothetical protein
LLGILLILLPDFKLQLVDAKRVAGAGPYELQGEERLGTSLIISPIDKNGPDLSKCNIQWHRVSVDGAKGGPVTGATRPQFSPEPFDVGWLLHANIILPNGKTEVASTSGPLDAGKRLLTLFGVSEKNHRYSLQWFRV